MHFRHRQTDRQTDGHWNSSISIARKLYWNTYGFWREVQNSNAASVTYLANLAFHANEPVYQTASWSVKLFLHFPPTIQSYLPGGASEHIQLIHDALNPHESAHKTTYQSVFVQFYTHKLSITTFVHETRALHCIIAEILYKPQSCVPKKWFSALSFTATPCQWFSSTEKIRSPSILVQ